MVQAALVSHRVINFSECMLKYSHTVVTDKRYKMCWQGVWLKPVMSFLPPSLKAVDTIDKYSKIIISIEPYLVVSNGERLIVQNIVRNGSLWIWFWDLRFRIRGLEGKHLKAHNFVWQGVFSYIIISQLRWPIELNFSQVCYFMHILGYT